MRRLFLTTALALGASPLAVAQTNPTAQTSPSKAPTAPTRPTRPKAPVEKPLAPAAPKAPLTLSSPSFQNGHAIPQVFTGEGKDQSPPLQWAHVPAKASELALIMDDPDAPGSKTPWVHWVLYHVHPSAVQILKEGLPTDAALAWPKGAMQGKNSYDAFGYRGPMPPPGSGVHHYHFKLYALDAPVKAPQGATKDELLKAMQGHVLAEAELVGTYKR